jgi:predicted ribosome quality control (RQC) complex YloA/Tae2 family protein
MNPAWSESWFDGGTNRISARFTVRTADDSLVCSCPGTSEHLTVPDKNTKPNSFPRHLLSAVPDLALYQAKLVDFGRIVKSNDAYGDVRRLFVS